MGNVYAVDAEQNLILYSTGKYICLRTSVRDNLTRPIVLCNDYASDLSDLVYHNTIYYVYQNTNRDIILRSVIEQNDLYRISSRNTPDCFAPQIAAIQNMLILFYFVKNPVDNTYCLKTILPFEPEQKLSLSGDLFSSEETPTVSGEAVFRSLPKLHILSVEGALLVHLSYDGEEIIFFINESLQCDKLSKNQEVLSQAQAKMSKNAEILTQMQAKLSKNEEMLSQTQAKLSKNEEVLSLTQTELDKSKELLAEMQKQNSRLQSELSGRDQLIQSISRQYEELMDTAMKYRDEAVKWHSKFYGK